MAQLPRSGVLKGFGGSTINLRAQLWLVPEFESKIRRNIIVDGYFKSFLRKIIGDLSYFSFFTGIIVVVLILCHTKKSGSTRKGAWRAQES